MQKARVRKPTTGRLRPDFIDYSSQWLITQEIQRHPLPRVASLE